MNITNETFKLIYAFKDYEFKLPENYQIVHWVPVIFPSCRNTYFFSKDVEHTFNEETRNVLIEKFNYKATSVYDTCGYNPLLWIIEDRDLFKTSKIISELKESGVDLSPNVFSYSTPNSILKRHGFIFSKENDDIAKKQLTLIETAKYHPTIIDLLEYIIYSKSDEFKGDEFQGEYSLDSLTRSKKETEDNILTIIKHIGGLTDNDLINELSNFHNNEEDYKKDLTSINNFIKDSEQILQYVYFLPIILSPILAFIFLKLTTEKKERESNINFIYNKLITHDNIIDLHQLYCSNEDFVLKVWANDIKDLDNFVHNNFYKKNIYTSTKVVLRPWKKEGWHASEISRYINKKKNQTTTLDHQILSVLDNYTDKFTNISEDKQIERIINILRNSGVENLRRYTIKSHLNKLKENVIEKYSVKLEQDQWIKTLIFVKAASGKKEKISGIVKKILLGITEISFARKFYHLTGEYDFIIPVDVPGLAKLRTIVDRFASNAGNLIKNIRIFTEISDKYIGCIEHDLELPANQQALICSPLPNAENYGGADDNSSPRRIFYKKFCKELNKGIDCASENFNVIKSFIKPTIEIKSPMMIHMFIRFRIKCRKDFKETLDSYRSINNQIKLGITLIVYKPLHDSNTCFCILSTNSFRTLLEFIIKFDKHCSSILPNLIFSQSFFEPTIPSELMCKPCISHQTSQCRACRQYPKRRCTSNIHNRDLKFNSIDTCKLAIIQTSKSSQKQHEIYSRIINLIKNGANIIVFPELTIPILTVKYIKQKLESDSEKLQNGKNIFIIPGSQIVTVNKHIYEKISLILFDKYGKVKEFSENFRNYPSDHDDKTLSYGNNGIWRYINTGYGNFVVLNCYDFFADRKALITKLTEPQNRIDLVIVVARNYSLTGMKHYADAANTFVVEGNQFVAIANNAGEKFGHSAIWGPIKNDDHSHLIEEIKSDEKIIYHEMDAIELDKSRAIKSNLLSSDEEKIITGKYHWRIASEGYGPIHADKWSERPVEQSHSP